jgi:hypothetical protein
MKRLVMLLTTGVALVLAGCISTARFDQRAYETAVELKVDSLVLMERSINHYTNHVMEVEAILLRARKAHEYAKGIPNNDRTVSLWVKLNDVNQGSLAGYLKDWKDVGQFAEFEVEESIPLIENNFDAIIELETAKLK